MLSLGPPGCSNPSDSISLCVCRERQLLTLQNVCTFPFDSHFISGSVVMALLYLEYYPKGKKIIIQSTVIHPAVSHSREVVVWPLPLHHPSITVEEPSLLRWRVARGRTRPPYLTPNVHIQRLSDLLLPTSSPSSVWLAKMSQ